MIFFEKDWDYYPTAIVDDRTKNISWIRYCNLLEKMGVKNAYFPLALIDKGLRDIDPFDKDLPIEYQKRVLAECADNNWYFLRELVRVPPKGSPLPAMLEANRGNIALNFLALNSIDVGITQIRQTGKTLNCIVTMSYMGMIKTTNTVIQLMTRSRKLRTENIEAFKEIRKLLPWYVGNYNKLDADNMETVTYKNMGNKIITQLPQNSEDEARGAGRGFTSSLIMIDESAFCDNIHASYPSMMSSSNAASDESRRAGIPTFKLFPCTAGDKGSKEGAFMFDLYHNVCRWRERLFDCEDRDELYEMVRSNSRNRRLMVYIELNHRQLGKSDEWLYDKIIEANGTKDDTDRDYFNQWTSGSGASPLDREVRETINKSEKEPVWEETFEHNYLINWYISKEELANRVRNDIKLIAGLDSSEGLGNDQLTIVIIDELTLETLGTCVVADTVSTIHFSNFVCNLLVKYKNMVLIPERRSTGIVIIDTLLIQLPMHGEDPFRRVFNLVSQEEKLPQDLLDFYNTPVSKRNIKTYERMKGYFGYATSKSGNYSRSNLYELTLNRMSNYAANVVRDKSLIDEIMGLVVKDGRVDHKSSGHDDTIIAWLLGGWLLNFGRNLSQYGITNPLLKVVSFKEHLASKNDSKQDTYNKHIQKDIRTQLSLLVKQLGECQNDMDAIFIEKRIKHLGSKLEHDVKLPMSIDELMKSANEMRRNKHLTGLRGWGR